MAIQGVCVPVPRRLHCRVRHRSSASGQHVHQRLAGRQQFSVTAAHDSPCGPKVGGFLNRLRRRQEEVFLRSVHLADRDLGHEDGLRAPDASGEGPDTLEVAYEARYASTPIELDVGPWSSGPLAGQTLFGIVELQGPDRFRVDFEPAGPDSDGAERPATFSEQTVTFVRKVN